MKLTKVFLIGFVLVFTVNSVKLTKKADKGEKDNKEVEKLAKTHIANKNAKSDAKTDKTENPIKRVAAKKNKSKKKTDKKSTKKSEIKAEKKINKKNEKKTKKAPAAAAPAKPAATTAAAPAKPAATTAAAPAKPAATTAAAPAKPAATTAAAPAKPAKPASTPATTTKPATAPKPAPATSTPATTAKPAATSTSSSKTPSPAADNSSSSDKIAKTPPMFPKGTIPKIEDVSTDSYASNDAKDDYTPENQAKLRYFFQPVNYVKSISPAAKAQLERQAVRDPEYERLLQKGFETPKIIEGIIDRQTTKVAPPVNVNNLWKNTDYADKHLWQNVEFNRFGNPTESRVFQTPARYRYNDVGQRIVSAPSDARMQITASTPTIMSMSFKQK